MGEEKVKTDTNLLNSNNLNEYTSKQQQQQKEPLEFFYNHLDNYKNTTTNNNVNTWVDDYSTRRVERNKIDVANTLSTDAARSEKLKTENQKDSNSDSRVTGYGGMPSNIQQKIKDSQQIKTDLDNFPKTGSIAHDQIDFSRIARTKDNASNNNFIPVNDSLYGDNGELSYQIQPDGKTVLITENGVPMGWTDLEGIKGLLPKVETEVKTTNAGGEKSNNAYDPTKFTDPKTLTNDQKLQTIFHYYQEFAKDDPNFPKYDNVEQLAKEFPDGRGLDAVYNDCWGRFELKNPNGSNETIGQKNDLNTASAIDEHINQKNPDKVQSSSTNDAMDYQNDSRFIPKVDNGASNSSSNNNSATGHGGMPSDVEQNLYGNSENNNKVMDEIIREETRKGQEGWSQNDNSNSTSSNNSNTTSTPESTLETNQQQPSIEQPTIQNPQLEQPTLKSVFDPSKFYEPSELTDQQKLEVLAYDLNQVEMNNNTSPNSAMHQYDANYIKTMLERTGTNLDDYYNAIHSKRI